MAIESDKLILVKLIKCQIFSVIPIKLLNVINCQILI